MSHPKVARTDHDVHELIRQRWSPRAFAADRPVPREDWMRLFEAARWAPSSRNEQPWRFVAVDRASAPQEWQAVLQTLTPKNRAWAEAAPLFVLTAVRLTYEDLGGANRMAFYDTGHAVGLLTLQATSQGLSVRQMEGFDREAARRACGIPEEFDVAVVMAIGYRGDPEQLAIDAHREGEHQPRRRKSLRDFVYEGRWGQG